MKKFKDIVTDMVTWLSLTNSRVTNFSVGSVVRSIIEAVAMEVESLYYFIAKSFEQLQEDSLYKSFGFQKNPSTYATGTVTVKFIQILSQSVSFQQGFRFYTIPINGETVYFDSTADVVANIGATSVDIPVKCTQAGIIGNVPAFTIRKVVSSAPFMSDVYNQNRFFTGAPEESKEERNKRFSNYLDSIARATPSAVQYGCMQVPGIAGIYIKEDIGMIYVYAHDSDGNLDASLKTSVENALFNYKAAGVKSFVSGVTRKPIDLSIQIQIDSGYNKDAVLYKVSESVTTYLNKFTVSKSLVKMDLIRHIMEIDKEAIKNISMDLAGDVAVDPQELIRAGTLQVTEMVV
jgi:hypothetical protein